MLWHYKKQEQEWQNELSLYQDLDKETQSIGRIGHMDINENTETENSEEEDINHLNHSENTPTQEIYTHILPEQTPTQTFRLPENTAKTRPEPTQEPAYFEYFRHLEYQKHHHDSDEEEYDEDEELEEYDDEYDENNENENENEYNDEDDNETESESSELDEIHEEQHDTDLNNEETATPVFASADDDGSPKEVITLEEAKRNLYNPLQAQSAFQRSRLRPLVQPETVILNPAKVPDNPTLTEPLEEITLEEALRSWQHAEDNTMLTPAPDVNPLEDKSQFYQTFSSVRERTMLSGNPRPHAPFADDVETIEIDDIRDSLMRQRQARHKQTLAEAPIHSTILMNVIPEEEVLANLARSQNSPLNRTRRIQRKTPLVANNLKTIETETPELENDEIEIAPPPAPVFPRVERHHETLSLENPVSIAQPTVVPMREMIVPEIMEQASYHHDFHQNSPNNHYSYHNHNDYFNDDIRPHHAHQNPNRWQEHETEEIPPEPPKNTVDYSQIWPQETEYPLPSTQLLLPAQYNHEAEQTEEQLIENGIIIEEKLAEFRVKVKVVDAYAGPVITRYEIEPDTGVRGNSVLNLEKDLARSLGMPSIRVVETIPNKNCMGIELPNPKRQIIRISEIFNSQAFKESRSKLTLALGQDITGSPVVTDLAKAPHLLVAGTTGSGKSVGVNSMILSMLFKATPEDVRMIMIDPKMLELSIYEGIPHLLSPVITDMKYAAHALNWCVNEMEKRYRLMSHLGVRNITSYNVKIIEAQVREQKIPNPFSLSNDDPEPLEKLPFIVVVVDEFADLMMVAGKKIEELIARLAQKARAAGIHLILATQRPSVDVITGLIKANIPTRIAFQVSSKIDSRTILDQMGAENLLGQGDMLFLPPGMGYPQRVHGAFVDDNEVHRIVDYLKQFGEPNYVEEIMSPNVSDDGDFSFNLSSDSLFDEAVALVLKTQKASISSIQRHLRIGYNKAATLMEQMEKEGIVSAADHAGKRTILAQNNSFHH